WPDLRLFQLRQNKSIDACRAPSAVRRRRLMRNWPLERPPRPIRLRDWRFRLDLSNFHWLGLCNNAAPMRPLLHPSLDQLHFRHRQPLTLGRHDLRRITRAHQLEQMTLERISRNDRRLTRLA